MVGIMHVVDSLHLGGTERVAVNLVNSLPRDRYRPYLCSTRLAGPLASSLNTNVRYVGLSRRCRLDFAAALALRRFIVQEGIRLLHLHSSSLFFGQLVSLLSFSRRTRLIWHDHCGAGCEREHRPVWLYRLAIPGIAGVIAVNHRLADWSRRELRVPAERVWYVPNFVLPDDRRPEEAPALPGMPGCRFICVANLRPEKDHLTLFRAMAIVCTQRPKAHLLLAGGALDRLYLEKLQQELKLLGLERNVSFLGHVRNVAAILRACDVGVLSSTSEGLPLSLLEYGQAGIPAIATSVGQCPEVLDYGKAGTLVEPASPEQLAAAMLSLLDSPQRRVEEGFQLREYIARTFNPAVIVSRICQIYEFVLSGAEP